MLLDNTTPKFRERYAGRRIEDKAIFGGELTHPLDVASGATENLPLKSEVILDFGRMFNSLSVRKLDGKFKRMTSDREDILEMVYPEIFTGQGMVLAPESKLLVMGEDPLSYTRTDCPDVEQIKLGLFGSTGTTPPTSTKSQLDSLTKNQLAQLAITGEVGYQGGGGSAIKLGLHWQKPTPGLASSPILYPGHNMEASQTHTNLPSGATLAAAKLSLAERYDVDGNTSAHGPNNPIIRDYAALRWLHSSALSFLHQWRTEFKAISSQTQYLATELVGFYDKGLKGDFLRHYDAKTVFLMFNLVELGAAVRRNEIVFNNHSAAEGYAGATNLFYTVMGNHSNTNTSGTADAGETDMDLYTPWWLSLAIDRYHFIHDDDISDVRDIHREDLFTGVKLLMEAASYEYGALTSTIGNPYMDFFENFDNADLPDLTDLSSTKAARTLGFCGYEDVQSYDRREDPNPNNLKMSYFSNFVSSNKISQTERLDLQRDLEELDSLSLLTGGMFKQGQLLSGAFEHTVNHRLTRFGSSATDLQYKPYVLFRPMRYTTPYTWDAGTNIVSVDGATDLGTSDVGEYDQPTSTYVDWVAFPSIKQGWASIAHNVMHPSGHGWLGYGTISVGSMHLGPAYSNSSTLFPNFSRSAAIDVNYSAGSTLGLQTHGGVPLCPEGYWRVGHDALLPSFVRGMNKVYTAWQGRTSGLFRRSELKGMMSWSSYNVRRELKMQTPDPLFAKFGSEIMNLMSCGGTGFDPGIINRHTNRFLDVARVHSRSAVSVFGGSTTTDTDADLVLSPVVSSATAVEDLFTASHWMGMLMGQYAIKPGNVLNTFGYTWDTVTGAWSHDGTVMFGLSGSLAGSGANTLNPWVNYIASTAATPTPALVYGSTLTTSKLGRYNAGANEYSFFPLVYGMGMPKWGNTDLSLSQSDIPWWGGSYNGADLYSPHYTAVAGRTSCLKTFYHNYKSLDGDITYVSVTPIHQFNSAPSGLLLPLSFAQHDKGGFEVLSGGAADYKANGFMAPHIYNFRTEVAGQDMGNGTTYDLLPGMRDLFHDWLLFEGVGATAFTFAVTANDEVVPSICTSFGLGSVASSTGTDLQLFGDYGNKLPKGFRGTVTVADITAVSPHSGSAPTLSNVKWLEYLEVRSGGLPGANGSTAEPADIRRWRERAPSLFMFDQDILDTSEALLGVFLYVLGGQTSSGQNTYMSVLNPAGEVVYEIRDSYGWGQATTSSSAPEAEFDSAPSATGDVGHTTEHVA